MSSKIETVPRQNHQPYFKSYAAFLEVKKKKNPHTGIVYIFNIFLAKSLDVSPMDDCAFGLLKRGLSKHKTTKID